MESCYLNSDSTIEVTNFNSLKVVINGQIIFPSRKAIRYLRMANRTAEFTFRKYCNFIL